MCAALTSSQSTPKSDGCGQGTGKQREGEQRSVRINREGSREGAGLEGEMHRRQAAGLLGTACEGMIQLRV